MNLKRIYIQGQQCKIEDRVDLLAEITRHLRVVASQKKNVPFEHIHPQEEWKREGACGEAKED